MRASGIILPVTALPSAYGIGDLGRGAREFVDFLAEAGQKYWQVLPVGRPSGGNSPYQTDSAFACDPAWIDPEEFVSCGVLKHTELDEIFGDCDPDRVHYAEVSAKKEACLRLAWERIGSDPEKFSEYIDSMHTFRESQSRWLEDYALYAALKKKFACSCADWPEEYRTRKSAAADTLAEDEEVKTETDFQVFMQYMFSRQWTAMHAYAASKGVGIIGDIPIYVPLDSADVWARPEQFQLDESGRPVNVAGCPPDYFSEDGQLWGNPLYNWDRMRGEGYGWWIERIDRMGQMVDVLRIDHFRGIESYYSIPADAKDAKHGVWVKGPGIDLIGRLTSWFPDLKMIAEDLGTLTPEVWQLLEDSGLPGMKVLQFAFDADGSSSYLPHKYDRNCICYTGTHDNETLAGWLETCPEDELAFAKEYLGLNDEEGYLWGVIRGGMSSPADLFMAQMQDYLELSDEARMNTPGTVSDKNWSWRLNPDRISQNTLKVLSDKLVAMCNRYGRI